MTDTFGHRLSGSPELNAAIHWAAAEMKRDGLENVHTERVMVPKWVRGRESAEIVEPSRHTIAMLGLGDSIGTRPARIQAEVLVVASFADLESRSVTGERADRSLQHSTSRTTKTRGPFESNGPSRAARYGAVAALVRSVGPPGLRLPHTGALFYEEDAPKIPAAAIATEDADRLQRMADRGDAHRRPAADGGALRARRRVVQSGRRVARTGAARTSSSSSAATSTRGTSARARATMPADAWRRGTRCA